MASFSSLTPLVDLQPTSSPLRVRISVRILLPALAFPVLVPERRRSSLNVFQRALLGLCRAGVRDRGDLAVRLDLSSALVDFMIEQLRSTAFLEAGLEPTQHALRTLDEGTALESSSVTSGHVFLDPFTGALWPRFVEGPLTMIDLRFRDRRRARYEVGDVGSPKKRDAYVVWPPDRRPSKPSVRAVLAAYQRDARDRRRTSSEGVPSTRSADRVSVLDHEPTPVFLPSFIFVPYAESGEAQWQAADPFGLGMSRDLRRRLESLCRTDDTVARALDELASRAYGVAPEEVAAVERARRRDALAIVEPWLETKAGWSQELAAKLIELEQAHADADRDRRNVHARLALARTAYAAVEEVLGDVLGLFPPSRMTEVLGADRRENGRHLARIAREQLGLQTNDGTERFLAVSRDRVAAAFEDDREMIALLAASLLTASLRSDHPLVSAAVALPEMLPMLAELKAARDPSSHDSGRWIGGALIDELRPFVYAVAGALLPSSGRALQQVETTSSAEDAGPDVPYRLRAKAELTVAQRFEERLRSHPRLRGTLIEMEVARSVAVALAEAHAEVGSRASELVIAAAMSVEAALKLMLGDLSAARVPPDLPAEIMAAAAKLHIAQLPRELTTVRPENVDAVLRTNEGTLGAMLVASLLASSRDFDHPLWIIAERDPRFFERVAAIIRARGHGNRIRLSPDEAVRLTDEAYAIARAALEITG